MDGRVRALLDELYADGVEHDANIPDRLRRRRNLEPDAAALLTMILRIGRMRTVVEIGTSNGYSAIWLADAVSDTGGRVTSVDIEADPGVAANLEKAGFVDAVELRIEDGGAHLASIPSGTVDLLFLDAERVEYAGWWPHPVRVLRPGGVLAVDNVLSHPDEVEEFLGLVNEHGEMVATTVPVGKGLYLAWRKTS